MKIENKICSQYLIRFRGNKNHKPNFCIIFSIRGHRLKDISKSMSLGTVRLTTMSVMNLRFQPLEIHGSLLFSKCSVIGLKNPVHFAVM